VSLLSGNPVSATVVAAAETEVYAVPRATFLSLVDNEPDLRNAMFELLVHRLRHTSFFTSQGHPAPFTLLAVPRATGQRDDLRRALFRGVQHYVPGSLFVDTVRSGPATATTVVASPPPLFPATRSPVAREASPSGPPVYAVDEGPEWIERLITNWRDAASAGRALVVALEATEATALAKGLDRGDLVLLQHGADESDEVAHPGFGLADVDHIHVGEGTETDRRAGPWRFRVPAEELARSERLHAGSAWSRDDLPTLDWIARRITRREIGIAMGAGSASGFAHLGVLQVLEDAGVVVDYACGSSMGGVVALVHARLGNARVTTDRFRELVGSNDKLRDFAWLPRSAILRGKKRRRAAKAAMGDDALAQLRRPVAVVAADLVRGERFVFEDGPGDVAMLATSALPGIFPPVPYDGRMLVDGGLVSRVPVDLLERRRCGLKIAVNVVPAPATTEDEFPRLSSAFFRYFGLTNVIASSWGLLAWWQGAAEASQAEVLLEPRRGRYSGYDFDAIEAMIEAGREAALDKLDMIRALASNLLTPGVRH
jgi:NTE family protein